MLDSASFLDGRHLTRDVRRYLLAKPCTHRPWLPPTSHGHHGSPLPALPQQATVHDNPQVFTAYQLWPLMSNHLFNVLCGTAVSCQIFIRSQSLIVHWAHNDLSFPSVACDFYEACCINDVSRGSNRIFLHWLIFTNLCVVSLGRQW